jgi:lipopolysaccharide assembly protein A
MRFLRVFIGALFLLILIVFAVANKKAVSVSIDPLPFEIELPLYLLVFAVFFGGLVVGVVIGRLNAWSAARQKAGIEKRRAEKSGADQKPVVQTPPPPAPIV